MVKIQITIFSSKVYSNEFYLMLTKYHCSKFFKKANDQIPSNTSFKRAHTQAESKNWQKYFVVENSSWRLLCTVILAWKSNEYDHTLFLYFQIWSFILFGKVLWKSRQRIQNRSHAFQSRHAKNNITQLHNKYVIVNNAKLISF